MYPADPHTDHPSEVLTYCSRLASVLRSWAWAMSSSDVGGNLDPDDFEGIATIATTLETTLKNAERHVQQECDCFKEHTSKGAKNVQVDCWSWPLIREPSHYRHNPTPKA